MILTRRGFGRFTAAGVPWLCGFCDPGNGSEALAQTFGRRINSVINGVQIGLQPFCYHDLPMTVQNRPTLIQRMVQNGLGVVELHSVWVEPRFTNPGIPIAQAREKSRAWRLSASPEYYGTVKREFDAVGISVFSYWINIDESFTDAEIDAVFEAAKLLGAGGVIGSWGLKISQRLAPFPAKHGMFAGLHNHDNLSDPDAYSNEESFIKGLAISPDFKANLDVRHFTAANGDCLGFLERHHARVCSVHLGDRRKNNGRSTPFGEGDSPIIEILRLIRDNQWPIVALLEFEHGTLRTGVEETQIAFEYCKRALS